ncbi:MAG: AI-2E family transporter [Chloroflexi bacterium]|nr:AI-2E family transporter [Chloroflexota bacterium]
MSTRDPWIRALVIVLVAICSLYLAGLIWQIAAQFADVILLFFLAWIVAFVLEPVVDFLERGATMPRPAAVTVAYVGMLIVGATGVIWFVPALSRQIIQLSSELPAYLAFLEGHFVQAQALLDERGLTANIAALLQIDELVRRVEAVGPLILANAVTLATGIASFIVQLILVLMLSFYIMLDGQRIIRGLLAVMPLTVREDAVFFLDSVNRAFAGFLRGQLIQALLYSLGTAFIMWMAGLDLILLTAVVNTVLMMIPFVGPPLALVLPLSIAVFESTTGFLVVWVLVVALQTVVVNVVAPRVMSSAVGVHPLLVFLGILAGAKLAGVWGALFGVPVVAVMATMATFYHAMLEDRRTRSASSLASVNPGHPQPMGERLYDDADDSPVPSSEGPSPLETPAANVPPTAPVGPSVRRRLHPDGGVSRG